MSRLLSRAKANYLMAEYIYTRVGEDDVYMDSCCCSLSQTIELALKFIVEMTGNNYAENHDIRANLNILSRSSFELPFESELRNKAKLLYEWETESRYKESFVAAYADVDEVRALAKDILDFAESLITPIEVEPVEDM